MNVFAIIGIVIAFAIVFFVVCACIMSGIVSKVEDNAMDAEVLGQKVGWTDVDNYDPAVSLNAEIDKILEGSDERRD